MFELVKQPFMTAIIKHLHLTMAALLFKEKALYGNILFVVSRLQCICSMAHLASGSKSNYFSENQQKVFT